MSNAFLPYRYSFFALFIAFNSIICSLAVWNVSIAQSLLLATQSSVYLAVISGFAVLFVIPITFVDIFRNGASTSRVWFELTWVVVFWVLELCGASAFTALMPDAMCTVAATRLQSKSCVSAKSTEAFAWLCTAMILVYLAVLFVAAVIHMDNDPTVWHASVRFYPWFATKSTLGSSPPSPAKISGGTRWDARSFRFVAPRPQRPPRPGGIDIEVGTVTSATTRDPPQMQQQQSAQQATFPSQQISMYSPGIAATIGASAGIPPATGETPPPLGNWPRPIDQQPQRQSRRYPRLPPPPQPPSTVAMAVRSPTSAPILSVDTGAGPSTSSRPRPIDSSRASRPSLGPRTGSGGSPTRRAPPPPLDLTRISSYNAIEDRKKQTRLGR